MMIKVRCDILDEFKDINFKDERLNERFGKIMQSLETCPSGLISKAFIDAKDQKAAYRFLNNEKTSYKTMFSSHQERVRERCQNHKVILAIQDSTAILLKGSKKVPGIGNIGNLKSQHPGLNIHTSILVTPQQEILGISDLHVYERKIILNQNKTHKKLPALKKETGKWLRSIENTRDQISSDVKLVWIADREGDFWDYFSMLKETNELFVQRVVHKRELQDCEEDYFTYLKKQPIIGYHTVEVASRGGDNERKKQTVICEVRSAEISLKKPKDLPREMKTIQLRAIHIVEKTEEPNPLEWFLVTNIECQSFEDIIEKICWYQMRWTIEELFRVVKSGCGIEEMRLEDVNRLMKYILLIFIVGMRILWMTKLAKQSGDEPCTKAFSEEEWKILYVRKYKQKPEDGFVPTIKEAVRLLAIFGGFYEYNKKNDPGAMTIWRGMKRLKELIEGIETIKNLGLS